MPTTRSPSRPTTRILVVEDREDLRDLLVTLLESEGYAVETADDGARALERIHSGVHYDVVLLDLLLPVVDGLEVLAQLRREGEPHAPIVAMSALPSLRTEANRLGACAFVGKATDIDALLAVVARHAGKRIEPEAEAQLS